MGRDERKALIMEIERLRNSKVIVYFCGDRTIQPSNISSDAIRYIYDHLLAITKDEDKVDKIDLYLYARGGALVAPWSIVSLIREFAKKFEVLIPYKAYSATTLIAMGSDKIIIGKKGLMGPIDPFLDTITSDDQKQTSRTRIGTEDVSQYIKFIKERAGLTDQQAITPLVSLLADEIKPITLGRVQRAYSHIRLVAGLLLSTVTPKLEERRITKIIEALTDKIFLHGHGIGYEEANEIGLQVKRPEPDVEKIMWALYLEYEDLLKLNSIRDAMGYFDGDNDLYEENELTIVAIESVEKLHQYRGNLKLKRMRNIPPNPTINVNLNLQMPPDQETQQLPNQLAESLQNMLRQASQNMRDIVNEEIRKQSPISGIKREFIKQRWVELE